ncbi:hypothetical protein [Streptomyces melanogenes]|uniref:hypothetical protein n=1 Tax=Streptomyces melanogenes TaxID=67326 RepID=UPI00167CFF8B|nr:hypothetical protein [Streptomyces melanogenes]GGP72119.1 hypothetical protein GCM10010278_57720 [Streptomyces melanogenes]
MRFDDLLDIYRAPVVQDAYTRRRDWDAAHRIWSGPASVQPYNTFEDQDPSNETASTTLTAYLPISAEPKSSDRVLYNGVWYEVLGEPARWDQGRLRHVKVRLWGVTH